MHDYFLGLKNNLELSPTLAAAVSTRHNAIRTYLGNNHIGFRDAKLIGSLQRKTRISPAPTGTLDIDIVVVLGEFHNWVVFGGITPQAALSALQGTVSGSARYINMNPVQDAPTISITAADNVQVQLVPAYVDMIGADAVGIQLGAKGRGYWVAKDGIWQMADYDFEAEYITDQNELSNGYLVPVIKMLKAIKRVYFPELNSFPLEIIASRIIPAAVIGATVNNQRITYPILLRAFFDQAPAFLDGGIKVPGSKSRPIVLDPAQISSHKQMFIAIRSFIDSLGGGSQGAQVDGWRKLIGDPFPAAVA